MKLKMLSQGW